MTDKSGPYVVVEKDGKFIVDVPGLVLRGKSKSDAELWCEAFNDAYAAGFKAGLERAAEKADRMGSEDIRNSILFEIEKI
ncbi:MAG: hypothetical protein IPN65_03980 [Elusimicrobia bacterium]|nr:hypothetical protein [Elusimicrobiota bacterium]